jgi:hypothetical protein
MTGTFRDLMSVVDELKGYSARILEPDADALTSIQRQAFREKLAREIKQAGISFRVSHDDEVYTIDYSKISFEWSTAVSVRGTGTIADVMPTGVYPIRLSVGKQVVVRFEPRNLQKVDFELNNISNSQFAGLKKGSSYEFQGRTSYGHYYFKQAPNGLFEFNVNSGGAVSGFFSRLFG